jgi:hypothetical protein
MAHSPHLGWDGALTAFGLGWDGARIWCFCAGVVCGWVGMLCAVGLGCCVRRNRAGEPLPAFHGFPLRVFAPGYPGAAQGKWLNRIWVRDQVHDGPKMTGWAYRMPKFPMWRVNPPVPLHRQQRADGLLQLLALT